MTAIFTSAVAFVLSPLRGLMCFGLITQGCARVASLALGYSLFALSGLRVVSFLHKQIPLRNAVRVSNQRRYRQFLRRARHAEQFEAGFVRQAVALLRVHGLARPDEVFPSVLTTARARQNVVEAAF